MRHSATSVAQGRQRRRAAGAKASRSVAHVAVDLGAVARGAEHQVGGKADQAVAAAGRAAFDRFEQEVAAPRLDQLQRGRDRGFGIGDLRRQTSAGPPGRMRGAGARQQPRMSMRRRSVGGVGALTRQLRPWRGRAPPGCASRRPCRAPRGRTAAIIFAPERRGQVVLRGRQRSRGSLRASPGADRVEIDDRTSRPLPGASSSLALFGAIENISASAGSAPLRVGGELRRAATSTGV